MISEDNPKKIVSQTDTISLIDVRAVVGLQSLISPFQVPVTTRKVKWSKHLHRLSIITPKGPSIVNIDLSTPVAKQVIGCI